MSYAAALAFLADPDNAVRPSPGKFEGTPDERVANALYEASLEGCDDQTGSVDEGAWTGLIGRFLVQEDDRGFFDYAVYPDEAQARARFDEIAAVDDADATETC